MLEVHYLSIVVAKEVATTRGGPRNSSFVVCWGGGLKNFGLVKNYKIFQITKGFSEILFCVCGAGGGRVSCPPLVLPVAASLLPLKKT